MIANNVRSHWNTCSNITAISNQVLRMLQLPDYMDWNKNVGEPSGRRTPSRPQCILPTRALTYPNSGLHHWDVAQLQSRPSKGCALRHRSWSTVVGTRLPPMQTPVWFMHPTGSRGYYSPIRMPAEFFFQVWKFKKNDFFKVKIIISFVLVLATLLQHLLISILEINVTRLLISLLLLNTFITILLILLNTLNE